jgi:hypothetical protein
MPRSQYTIAATLAAGVILTCSSACSDPPKQGRVISNEFNAAHEDPYMYCGGYITTRSGNTTATSCTVWLIGYTHVPDQWSIKLLDDSDPAHVKKGWRGVDMITYHKCPIDAMFPDCLRSNSQ